MAASKVFNSVGHFFASIAHGIVKAAKAAPADAAIVAKDAAVVEPVVDVLVGATLGPGATAIERAAFAILGNVIATVNDASTSVQSNGLNLALDAKTIADVKALIPQFKTLAASVGVSVPTGVPVTTPAPTSV